MILKCCSLCLLHVWSEAKHVCYEKRAYGRPQGYIEISSTNCTAAVRSCPEQALILIDHCYYPFPFLSISGAKTQVQAATQNAIYRILLLIITHHYSSLCNSLLIITHHYSNSITHHYSPLHYLRWVKKSLRSLKTVSYTHLTLPTNREV